ncbi:hypothetical protein PHYC_02565 [Phycisphaerales bacterium]|nr:hypothetical protein PHYC_02565 [Phycisphaerales bacterium]
MKSRCRKAFTLVEAIVVVVIIAILIALIVGGLRGSRRSARTLKCLVNARSCTGAIATYQADFKDCFPYFAQPVTGPGAFRNGSYDLEYLLQVLHWPIALRGYSNGQEIDQTHLCPSSPLAREAFGAGRYLEIVAGNGPGYVFPSDYWLSYATITDPRLWSADGDVLDVDEFRPVRGTEVAFPSSKGLMVEPRAYHLDGPNPDGNAQSISMFYVEGRTKAFTVSFCDGHTATTPFASLSPGVAPLNFNPAGAVPVLATPGGVLGRDAP